MFLFLNLKDGIYILHFHSLLAILLVLKRMLAVISKLILISDILKGTACKIYKSVLKGSKNDSH